MAKRHEVAYIETDECGDLATFRFERPAHYAFAAGQYLLLTLTTDEGERHEAFTISSAPSDPFLEVTTRLTGSRFKTVLSALRVGDVVQVSPPAGDLVLSEDDRRVIFLTGGVGVTPARSIIRDAVQRDTGLVAILFFGNRTETCIPFRDELDAYDSGVDGIAVVHVVAEPSGAWRGETGFITADIVRRHVDHAVPARWMVSGPPAMLGAMEQVLADLGIPADEMSIESFAGYD